VAEVRAIRQQLFEKYGGVEGYLRHIRELDAERLQREREEAERREAAELGKWASTCGKPRSARYWLTP
jgi:hypothetical protein